MTTRARRRILEGTRWLLLCNATNPTRAERVRLRDVRRLVTCGSCNVLKDALKEIWRYKYSGAAARAGGLVWLRPVWLTGFATKRISSSRFARRSPEIREEPKKGARSTGECNSSLIALIGGGV